MGELESEGGEDELSVTPALDCPRAKETRAENSFCEANLSKRLSDGRLSGPCVAAQPKKPFALLVVESFFELLEDTTPRSLHAASPVYGTVPGLGGKMYSAQKEPVCISLFAFSKYIRTQWKSRAHNGSTVLVVNTLL